MLRHQQPEDAFLQSRLLLRCHGFSLRSATIPALCYPPKQHHAIGPRRATRDNQGDARLIRSPLGASLRLLEQGSEAPMEAIHDFDQLQLHFVDHVQWRYELIRPVVLIGSRTAAQRAEETHTHPDTKVTRRFRQQGTLGLSRAH